MKNILILTPYGLNSKIKHAGGKTSTAYFKKLITTDGFATSMYVLYVRSDDYQHFITEFASVKNISASPFRNLYQKCINYFFYNLIAKPLQGIFYKLNFVNYIKKKDLIYALKTLKQELYTPDIVICDFGDFLLQVLAIKKIFPETKCVAFAHDFNYKNLERRYAGGRLSRKRLKRFLKLEQRCLNACDLVMPHSSADHSAIKTVCHVPGYKLHTIVPYFDDYSRKGQKCDREHDHSIIFYGAMNRPENFGAVEWFLNNVWENLLQIRPELNFIVIGSGLPQSMAASWSGYKKVTITGFVADPAPYFQKALCSVVPLRVGSGIKVKVIEAMSVGLPVLTNDIGIEGIDAIDKKDYLYCKVPEDYINAVNLLCNDPELRYQMISSAYQLIHTSFDLERSKNDFIEALKQL